MVPDENVSERSAPSPAAVFIPVADAGDDRMIDVDAPPDLVFEVAKEIDLMAHPVVKAIFRVRQLVMGDRDRPRHTKGVVAETLALGWGVLSFNPGRTLVMGAIAQPWAKDVTFTAVDSKHFAEFSTPGVVKIVWTLEADGCGQNRTRFRTETRVVATDPVARRKFMRYWRFVSPGIHAIRWFMVRSVRRQAEERFRQSIPPHAGRAA
jgi:hypothetical protein